ncbi:MAG: hypothetical protein ACRCY3_01180 [Sphingorhabdus sp.]
MTGFAQTALVAGLIATIVTTPVPAFAAAEFEQAVAREDKVSIFEETADYHRRRWRNRRLDVDAGDVIVGIGLIAAIAAIAGSADKNNGRQRPRDYDRPSDYDPAPEYRGGDDVGSAVSSCTEAVERSANGRVNEIRSVTRAGTGWRVEGDVGKEGFTCDVTGGRVDNIRFDDRGV